MKKTGIASIVLSLFSVSSGFAGDISVDPQTKAVRDLFISKRARLPTPQELAYATWSHCEQHYAVKGEYTHGPIAATFSFMPTAQPGRYEIQGNKMGTLFFDQTAFAAFEGGEFFSLDGRFTEPYGLTQFASFRIVDDALVAEWSGVSVNRMVCSDSHAGICGTAVRAPESALARKYGDKLGPAVYEKFAPRLPKGYFTEMPSAKVWTYVKCRKDP